MMKKEVIEFFRSGDFCKEFDHVTGLMVDSPAYESNGIKIQRYIAHKCKFCKRVFEFVDGEWNERSYEEYLGK